MASLTATPGASGILLIHVSAFQIYCANRLFRAGAIRAVVVEDGDSVVPERPRARDVFAALRAGIDNTRTDPRRGPRRAVQHLLNVAYRTRYYGRRTFHHQRLLIDFDRLRPGLRVYRVQQINAPAVIEAIHQERPDIVFVHGTSLIQGTTLASTRAPFVNLHWGRSPQYRGEGIVSALALEGTRALGVTVHVIDQGVDSGPILSQAAPTVDLDDNFYSIGVKLTILGTERFLSVLDDFSTAGGLAAVPQDRSRSRLFSGSYMRAHPELFAEAWRNLCDEARGR